MKIQWVHLAAALLLAGSLALRSNYYSVLRDQYRLPAWRIAGLIFAGQPWLGSGPGTFIVGYRMRKTEILAGQFFDTAHDDWLEILATMGLAGLAAYAWLHAAALAALLALRRGGEGRGMAPAAAAAAAMFVYMKFNPANVTAAWIAAVLAGVMLARPEGEESPRLRPGPEPRSRTTP